jgi:Serine dehydrogenase proteinase
MIPIDMLTTGKVTHDYPITVEEARALGFAHHGRSAPDYLRLDGTVSTAPGWSPQGAVYSHALRAAPDIARTEGQTVAGVGERGERMGEKVVN